MLKSSPATMSLISRRCTRRLGKSDVILFAISMCGGMHDRGLNYGVSGTRMWRRGANLEGDVANFIETEQILDVEGFRSSLLQVILLDLLDCKWEKESNTLIFHESGNYQFVLSHQ